MLFFLILISSLFISIAIDVGTSYTKSALAQDAEIIGIGCDCQNKKITPTFIAFRTKPHFNSKGKGFIRPDETQYLIPEIGEKAINILKIRPNMGAGYFPDLIELNDTYKEERSKELGTRLNATRVNFHDLTALFYKMYIDCISKEKKVNDVILAVPSKFIFLQRYQLEIALRYAGYDQISIIDDSDAVSYLYANEKSSKFSRGPKNVLFIDFGATSVKSYVIKFYQKKTPSGRSTLPAADRLSYQMDYSTGGVFITQSIAKYFKKKGHLNPQTEAENQRLFDAAEKIKQKLSSESESFVIANEIEGIDRTLKMTREELETHILQPFVKPAVDIALLALNGTQFDHIEFLGGCSKIDFLVKSILEGLGISINDMSELDHYRTLDPIHTISKGAGYYIQFLRSISRFPDVKISEPSSIFDISLSTMDAQYQLCTVGKECKKNQAVAGNSSIILFEYGEKECRQGLHKYSYGFFLDNATSNIMLNFYHHPFTLYMVETCDQTGCHNMRLQLLTNPETPTRSFRMFFDPEAIGNRLNEVKGTLNNLTKKVLVEVEKNRSFRFFTNYSQRIEIIRCAESTKKWMKENEFRDNVHLSNFSEKLEALESLVEPVYARISENTTFLRAVNMYYRFLDMAKEAIQNEWPKEKPFMDKRTLNRFIELVNESETWFNNSIELSRNTPPYLPRPVKANEYEEEAMKLFDYFKIADAIERKKKRTGRKLKPEEQSKGKEEEDDDDEERHNPEYEYIDMDDEEMEAYYAANEWVDPFIETEEEKSQRMPNGVEKFKISREMKHFFNKRLKKMDEMKENENANKEEEKEKPVGDYNEL